MSVHYNLFSYDFAIFLEYYCGVVLKNLRPRTHLQGGGITSVCLPLGFFTQGQETVRTISLKFPKVSVDVFLLDIKERILSDCIYIVAMSLPKAIQCY